MTKQILIEWIESLLLGCDECIANGECDDTCPEVIYNRLQNHFTPHWIPTTERLPDTPKTIDGEEYLVTCKDENGVFVDTIRWLKGYNIHTHEIVEEWDLDSYIDENTEVVAWQPLPEPYQEVKTDECS